MFQLAILSGPRAGQVVPVLETLIVGREKTSDLVVDESTVGRQHAEFRYSSGRLVVDDPGSRNGTYLNGRRISGSADLRGGDIVQIGSTNLRVEQSQNFAATLAAIDDVSVTQLLEVKSPAQAAVAETGEISARRLFALMKVSKALIHVDTLDRVFEDVLSSLFELLPAAERAFILLGDAAETLQVRAGRTRRNELAHELKWSATICRRALESRQAIRFDMRESPRAATESMVQLFSSALAIPLVVGEAVLGLLQIDSRGDRAFERDDLESAAAIGQQAALAIHVALLVQRIDRETRTRDQLTRFLPAPLVEQAIRGTIDLALGGKEREATILFSDIIGFTRLSEGLSAEAVIELMNGYFAAMVPKVYETEGSIDKFMGDAIMAVWGVHSRSADAARLATTAALEMQNSLTAFNSGQRLARGPELHLGIGINTGPVVAGNIGAERRVEYTVLGDAVNTAQRIESAACRSQILVGATTRDRIGDCVAIRMPPLKVKNKSQPLSTYSVRGIREGDDLLLHLPVTVSGAPMLIIRQSAKGRLTILHEAGAEVAGALAGAVAELPAGQWARIARVMTVLPGRPEDRLMIRSEVEVDDPSLGGILTGNDLTAVVSWEQMARA